MRSALPVALIATMLLALAACATEERDTEQDLRRPPPAVPGSVNSFHPEEDF